jgi:integrase
MANTKVSLLRYAKTKSGWRRMRVHITRKGRGWDEKLDSKGERVFELGQYQLKWYEGSKAKYKGAGNILAEARIACEQQVSELEAQAAADRAGLELSDKNPERKLLADEKTKFVRRKKMAGKDAETVSAYENLITEFLTVTGRRYADQLVEDDMLAYCDALRQRGLSERTVMNYYGCVSTFLRHCGIDHKQLVQKEHRPHKQDPDPEAYTEEEARKFFSAIASECHSLFFEFLLKTGAREKEAAFAEWTDINWSENVVTIRGEKTLRLVVDGKEKVISFKTKTRRSRDITLEAGLLSKLQLWRKKNPKTRFIFGTGSDLPNGHYLELCKNIAAKANLNCGTCESCLHTDGKQCERWFLHRWRNTFATWSLQRGVDIRTVQQLMGHTKLEMTARYLAAAKGKAAQERLNAVFAGI